MADPSALRVKLFVGLFIFILLFAFVNKKIKQHPDQKIDGKGILFFNVIGLIGLACLVVLIISSYFD